MDAREKEWLESTDPLFLCDAFSGLPSARRERLLAVAICRRIKGLLIDPYSLHALDVLETLSESPISADDLAKVTEIVVDSWDELEFSTIFDEAQRHAVEAVIGATNQFDPARSAVRNALSAVIARGTAITVVPAFVELIRDVAGNPFRTATIVSEWRTSAVLALAESMYSDRAFDRMPILADALEDAGCDNEDILSHCRGPGPHVRGCWVVDLVLGKS